MEKIFARFPSLGKKVVGQLDDQGLAKSRIVNGKWKNFIDEEKTVWLRMIKKHVGISYSSQDWQNVIFKIPSKMAKDLAKAVCQFYQSEPTRFNEN